MLQLGVPTFGNIALMLNLLCASLTENLKILSIGRNYIKNLAGIVSLFVASLLLLVISCAAIMFHCCLSCVLLNLFYTASLVQMHLCFE